MYESAAPNTRKKKKLKIDVIKLEIIIMSIFLNLSAVSNFYNSSANLVVCECMGLSAGVCV